MTTSRRIGVNGETFDIYEILICEHCLILLANGECSDPLEHDTPEACPSPSDKWPEAESITLGRLDHAEMCGDTCEGDCGDYGFSQSSCEGCGDPLHGNRAYAVAWVPA